MSFSPLVSAEKAAAEETVTPTEVAATVAVKKKKASITTRRGDFGKTDLYNGDRVLKTDFRIEALGQLDSAQSIVGKLYAEIQDFVASHVTEKGKNEAGGANGKEKEAFGKACVLQQQLHVLHNVLGGLHDAMANVATPPLRGNRSRTDPKRLERAAFHDTLTETLEQESHTMEQGLPQLREFILPISLFSVHVARTQVRAAERWVLRVEDDAPGTVDDGIRIFLNRFSDYLFILARFLHE